MDEATYNLDGVYLVPDGWRIGELLQADKSGFFDSSFPGCKYRLPSCGGELAVNIKITGRKSHYDQNMGLNCYKSRVNSET